MIPFPSIHAQPRITWDFEVAGDMAQSIKVARYHCRPNLGWHMHSHEFAEVFWCESGTGEHSVNGEHVPLTAGDVVFVRASDRHQGLGTGSDGMTIVNVSFQEATMDALKKRYPSEWPWNDQPLPLQVHLSPLRMERLHAWAADLSSPYQRPIDLECFLLDLVRLVTKPMENDVCAGLPAWLRESIEIFSDPRHLRGGIQQLAHLSGRSPEHINRIVRAAQDRTTTDMINAVRMRWASAELRMSNRPIGDIAADCGLPHLGHFYESFKKCFNVTPRKYRMGAWQVMGRRVEAEPERVSTPPSFRY
jgi:AraC-like DNA-binding protein/mannose-6-phosphate isomerase-like protein (cupin superfamily)